MSTCRCCGQEIASAANTVIRVDEALLGLCNRAHEEARLRSAVQVEILHLAWAMVQARDLHEILEAFGCPVWALSEALEGQPGAASGAGAGAPRTSAQLKILLGRAEAHAGRDGRTYAGPHDAAAVLVHETEDLTSGAFMRRAMARGLGGGARGEGRLGDEGIMSKSSSHEVAQTFTVADLARSLEQAWPGRMSQGTHTRGLARDLGTHDLRASQSAQGSRDAFVRPAMLWTRTGSDGQRDRDTSASLSRAGRNDHEADSVRSPGAVDGNGSRHGNVSESDRERERIRYETARDTHDSGARDRDERIGAARQRAEQEQSARDKEAMRTLTGRLEKQERLLEQLVEAFSAYRRSSDQRRREREAAAASQHGTREADDDTTEPARQSRRARAHARWRRRRSWRSLRSWRKGNREGVREWMRGWGTSRRINACDDEGRDKTREDRLARETAAANSGAHTTDHKERAATAALLHVDEQTQATFAREPRRAVEIEDEAEPEFDAEEADAPTSGEREKRFYLALGDDIERAPSIGARTAAYLSRAGIYKVRDLLTCSVEQAAAQIGVRYITPQRLSLWQAQSRLVCSVPWLRGTHAQLLAGAGFDTIEKIAAADKAAVCAAILQFAGTRDGQSVLRAGAPPDIERVGRWVEAASLAEPERAAA